MELVVFKKGDVIFEEGKYESFMYSIHSGKVGIYSNYGKENEVLLTEVEKDGIFGEMGLIEARQRSATAVALEEVGLAKIDNDSFLDYFGKEPEKLIDIMKKMSHRLRELSDSYVDACNTITEYVKADEESRPKKKGLLDKIKKLIIVDEQYRDDYLLAMQRIEMSYMHDTFNMFL